MTQGKPLVKVKIVMPSDMQALLQFSSLPVLLFFQDLILTLSGLPVWRNW